MPKINVDPLTIPQVFPRGMRTLGQYLERMRFERDITVAQIEQLTGLMRPDTMMHRSYYSLLINAERTPQQIRIIKLEALRVALRAPVREFENAIGRKIPRGARLGPAAFGDGNDELYAVPVYADQLALLTTDPPQSYAATVDTTPWRTTIGVRWVQLERTFTDEHNAHLNSLLSGVGVTIFVNKAATPRPSETWLAINTERGEVALITGRRKPGDPLFGITEPHAPLAWDKTFKAVGVVKQIRYDFTRPVVYRSGITRRAAGEVMV